MERGSGAGGEAALQAGPGRHLEVAVATVENAYSQLVAEGYLYAEEKRGYFVSPLETGDRPRPGRGRPPLRPVLRPSSAAAGVAAGPDQRRSGDRGVSLHRLGPADAPGAHRPGEQLLRASPHNGVEELRRAVASCLHQFRGITVSPEQVVVGAGTEYLYGLIVQLLGRDLSYGVEDPGYPKAGKVYGLHGARCVPPCPG